MSNLITVQCIKQPNGNVNVYRGNKLYAWFDRDSSNKPTYRNKYVTIDCAKWVIEWIR